MIMPWLPYVQQVRRTSLLFFTVLQSTLSFAQNAQTDSPRLLEGMQFAFKLSNGFNTTQATHLEGASRLSGGLVHQHAFNLELFKYVGKSGLFIGINGGCGLNGFVFKTDTDLPFVQSDHFRYYDKLDAFEYLHADIGIGHSMIINPRWMIRNQLKVGIRSNPMIRSSTRFFGENSLLLDYLIVSHDNTHPLFRVESDFGVKLKNNDILELGVFYTYTTSLVYSGLYLFNPDHPFNNSMGIFENYGRELGLTLNYVFSGYSRRQALHSFDIIAMPEDMQRSVRSGRISDFRVERRIYKPSSWLIGVRTGLYFARFIVEKNTALETSSAPGLHFGINGQLNSSEKTFWEGDFAMNGYQESTKTKYSTSSSSGDDTFILTLSAGRGYRLIGKNHYNWLNLSAGLDVNYVGSEVGLNGTSRSRSFRDGVLLLEVNSVTQTRHRFYPGIYLSLSKDFRLGRNSFISLAYKRTEGFYSVIQNDIETSGSDIPGGMETFQSHFRGSANTFSLGFKRRFGN